MKKETSILRDLLEDGSLIKELDELYWSVPRHQRRYHMLYLNSDFGLGNIARNLLRRTPEDAAFWEQHFIRRGAVQDWDDALRDLVKLHISESPYDLHAAPFQKLLGIPAMGWLAFKGYLKSPGFDKGISRFIVNDRQISLGFFYSFEGSDYGERFDLTMPDAPMVTLGDEIRAMGELVKEANSIIRAGRERNYSLEFKPRKKFRLEWACDCVCVKLQKKAKLGL
jgi:hypothetical protein